MPGARHPDKVLVNLWVYRGVKSAIEAAMKARGISQTDLVLAAIAEHLGLTLDAAGNLPAEGAENLEVEALETKKRTSGKRSPRRSEASSGRQAEGASETGKPNRKRTGLRDAG